MRGREVRRKGEEGEREGGMVRRGGWKGGREGAKERMDGGKEGGKEGGWEGEVIF